MLKDKINKYYKIIKSAQNSDFDNLEKHSSLSNLCFRVKNMYEHFEYFLSELEKLKANEFTEIKNKDPNYKAGLSAFEILSKYKDNCKTINYVNNGTNTARAVLSNFWSAFNKDSLFKNQNTSTGINHLLGILRSVKFKLDYLYKLIGNFNERNKNTPNQQQNHYKFKESILKYFRNDTNKVKNMQKGLREAGLYNGIIDGDPGKQTIKGIETYRSNFPKKTMIDILKELHDRGA